LASQATTTALVIPTDVTLWPIVFLGDETFSPCALEQNCQSRVRPFAEVDRLALCFMGCNADIAVRGWTGTSRVMDPIKNARFIE